VRNNDDIRTRGNLATIGLVNLSEALLNQTVLEAQASQAATRSNSSTNILSIAIGDELTPSAQNTEQVAGLFTVDQFSQFSPAPVAVLVPADSAALATASAPQREHSQDRRYRGFDQQLHSGDIHLPGCPTQGAATPPQTATTTAAPARTSTAAA
jgi:hypothetical protein